MDNRIEEILSAALGKYRQGEEKHGAFDPATDQRDFLAEAEAEILDAINYLAMFILKVRAMRRYTEAARKAALQDGQDAGQVVIHAAARLGELLAAMPKTGNTLTSTGGRKGSLPPGVSHKTSHQAQTIAANPDKATRPHSVPICQLFKELFAERFGQGFVKLFAERFRQRFKKGGLLRP
ncbi:MAG TPA: hypothetical protein PK983_06155 [Syntrophales bacterium]|nr:hypothetical protein [Syntrophales bacterium]